MTHLVTELQKILLFKKGVDDAERVIREAEDKLEELYPHLIEACPHPEAVDWKYGSMGVFRVCTLCGIEDQASFGGQAGDEYDYGYPGRPDPTFWKDTEVRTVDSAEEHWTYRRRHRHSWKVINGRATN